MSISAVGRKYGVSDNAVRKWLRWHERERERERERQASEQGQAGEGDSAQAA
jgi:transposase-like protein